VTFDIRWDRLGVQAGTTTRGWFEGDAGQILRKLQKVSGIKVIVLHTDSAGKCPASVKVLLIYHTRDENRNSADYTQWPDEATPRGGRFYPVAVTECRCIIERCCQRNFVIDLYTSAIRTTNTIRLHSQLLLFMSKISGEIKSYGST